ncbi:hypothetical protein G6F56_012383 [Rhizopus delemar]|nr:hypothetical protein G6F56_012383 [Rhizopus delemar]
MSSSNDIPEHFLNAFEIRSGTEILSNEYNWNIPPEYLYCFTVDDEIMSEVVEESVLGLVDTVEMEWISYTGPGN